MKKMYILLVMPSFLIAGCGPSHGEHRSASCASMLENALWAYHEDHGAFDFCTEEKDQIQEFTPLLVPVLDPYLNKLCFDKREGTYIDSWGNKFKIILDLDNDGMVVFGKKILKQTVVVWSCGKNGKNEYGGGDDLWVPSEQ